MDTKELSEKFAIQKSVIEQVIPINKMLIMKDIQMCVIMEPRKGHENFKDFVESELNLGKKS